MMTKLRRRRLMFIAVLMIGLAATVALTLSAVSENLMYFYQPSEIAAGEAPVNTRFRVGGLVQPGSVQRNDNSLRVTFVLADCRASIPVLYTGILPDLFREGQGIIAYGKINAQGQFIADDVLAKHDASYMSPAVAEATTNDQGVSCMPANMKASALSRVFCRIQNACARQAQGARLRHSGLMTKERNAVIGAHRHSRGRDIEYWARLRAPVDCVAALDKGMALAGAPRLATNARSLAECDKIPVTGHLA